MGFIARTIFWLGLVYSAMPLDFGSLLSDDAARRADAIPLAACAHGASDCSRAIEDLRKAVEAAKALGMIDALSETAGPAEATLRRLSQSRAN